MHGKLRRYHFQWHQSHVQLKSKSSAIIKIILTFYKTENNKFFFFAEALEHGFAMTGAALRRRRCWERERKSKGGGLISVARTADDACWVVRMRRLKEELRGVLTTEADIGSSMR
jgi:hypothetical protein